MVSADTVSYDERAALLVIDMQNDFADPAGGLYVTGGEQILPAVNQQIERAVDAGASVVYTQDWHPPDTPHFQKDGGKWPVHCVKGTWGSELHRDLKRVGSDNVIQKGSNGEDGYSGFTVRDPVTGSESTTGLSEYLRGRSVSRVVIVGLAGDVCVKETALDAARLGFKPTVLRDATRAVNLGDGDEELAFKEMQQAGVVVA